MSKSIISGQSFEGQAQFFATALGRLPNNRAYAMDDNAKRAGVSIVRATNEATDYQRFDTEEFSKLLGIIGPFTNAIQTWKPGPIPPPPKPWPDEVTGLTLANPWADPVDRAGQAILLQRDPALAAHFKAMAENPYGTLARYQDEAKQRALLAALSYTANDHKTNPFRFSNLNDQSIFIASQPRYVIDVWKFEAVPVRLPWGSDANSINRTVQGQILEALNAKPWNGVTGDVIIRAAQIDAELAKTQREEAADAAARAQQRANELAAAARR